ncbi:MAG: hypothetical protein ACE5G9_11385 [Nitrospinales bacterium]
MSLGVAVSFADELLPGAYAQQDQSVMGVGKTMVEMGAADRALTNAVNLASGAGRSRNTSFGVNVDYQFGSSQSDQSWKAARTVEEAQVRGLVPGDCQGDNSTDAYRKQMNQSRDGYVQEKLIPNNICGDHHPTIKIGATN